MNKKLKDALIAGSILVGLGAIATSITVPLVLKKSDKVSLDWNEDELVGGMPGDDFIGKVEEEGEKDKSSLNTFNYQVAFYLYDQEQMGSLELQKQFFYWNIYEKEILIKEEEEKDSPSKDTIKEWNNDISKINEKIEKVNKEIAGMKAEKPSHGKGIDFKSSTLGSDYSRILLPLKEVREKRTKIFMDTKENFIKKYSTRQEGLNKWPDERRNLYDNAATDSQAIDYLTHQQITGDAFAQFRFKLNSDYTLEQKFAKRPKLNEDGTVVNGKFDYIFDFLRDIDGGAKPSIKDYTKQLKSDFSNMESVKYNELEKYEGEYYFGDNWKDIKSDKVYFVSTNSKAWEKLAIGSQLFSEILTTDMIEVNHALIAGKQSENGSSIAWSIEKDIVKKLLTIYGRQIKGEKEDELSDLDWHNATSANKEVDKVNQGYKLIDNLFPIIRESMTTEQVKLEEKNTRLFIDTFSDDPSGKDKYGSLGVMSVADYVSKMVPGFSFGVLAGLQRIQHEDDKGEKVSIQNWFKNELNKDSQGVPVWFDDIDGDGLPGVNEPKTTNFMAALKYNIRKAAKVLGFDGIDDQNKLLEKINDTDEEKIKLEFGKAFRETFDGNEYVNYDDDIQYDEIKDKGSLSNGKDGVRLIYSATSIDVTKPTKITTNNAYVVLSSHGVHTIKIDEYSSVEKVLESIGDDLVKVANEQNTSYAKNDYASLFQNHFDDVTRTGYIMEQYNDGGDNDHKEGKLYKYLKENVTLSSSYNDFETWWSDIDKIVKAQKTIKTTEKANEALGSKVNEFYITGIDKSTQIFDSLFKPEDIYQLVLDRIDGNSSKTRKGVKK